MWGEGLKLTFEESAKLNNIEIINTETKLPVDFSDVSTWHPQVEAMANEARIMLIFHYEDNVKAILDYIY